MNYQDFLASKQDRGAQYGFEPTFIPDFLFDFQVSLVDWAVRKGRAAIFADCGLGKTPMQLVIAQNTIEHTNKPALILTPLAVSAQTLDEAEKFDIPATRAIPGKTPITIQVTNYEQLHKFSPGDYGSVGCDESSILKNFKGQRKAEITEFMRQVPYRFLYTATAAPNDWIELGTSSEALGYLGYMDMLGQFFTNKQQSAALRRGRFSRDKWRLRGWAAEGPFWQWVSSWAKAARKPSDLGFDDDGFILPEMRLKETLVSAVEPTPGMMFDMPAANFFEEREAVRRTIQERCEAVAEIVLQNGATSMVWCNLNDEGDLLEKLIPGAVQVAGRHSDESKEEAARWFVHGSDEKRVLISKPSIFGFGLNFQHCQHMSYFPTWSYEQYYQATRRLWRFGQEKRVTVDLIYTDGGSRMLAGLQQKADQADEMFTQLVQYMNDSVEVENTYTPQKMEVPEWMR